MNIGYTWEGFLTYANMEEVANFILGMLDGKKFAVAEVNRETLSLALCVNNQLIGQKLQIRKGEVSSWDCFIKFFASGKGLSQEIAFYVPTEQGYNVSSRNSCYIRIGYNRIDFIAPTTRGVEHTVIELQ